MFDFFKLLTLLIEGLYAPIPPEVIDSRDPALAFQTMVKDYGIDLKPKIYDPKLEEDKPKNRVITSSKAPEVNYAIKADKFSDDHLKGESREIDINRLTQTVGGVFNPSQ